MESLGVAMLSSAVKAMIRYGTLIYSLEYVTPRDHSEGSGYDIEVLPRYVMHGSGTVDAKVSALHVCVYIGGTGSGITALLPAAWRHATQLQRLRNPSSILTRAKYFEVLFYNRKNLERLAVQSVVVLGG